MNRKLRLDQTKHYEQTIACELLAQMLVSFIEGKDHSLSIGGEQGDIPGWDDFVIERVRNEYTHLQVKRQLTDFSDKKRQCVRNKNSKNNYYDLSPLDKSMQSLANWIKNREASVSSHDFILVLPIDATLIKNGLEVRHLSDFCTNHIKETSTASKLAQLQSTDVTTKNIFNWLNTWCDFEDWQQILDAFLLLKIKMFELEEDIKARSLNVLGRVLMSQKRFLI